MEYAKGGPVDPSWILEFQRYLATSGCTYRLDPAVVAQHTYTPICDGFHQPGPCPSETKESEE